MMHLVFHAGPLDEFMLLMPLLRAMGKPLGVVAPWQRASLASHMVGAMPMDIELFEFTRLHAEGGPSRVSPAVGDLFGNATHIVSFLSAERDAWADNVARLAPQANLILCEPRPTGAYPGHFTDWHLANLAKQGLDLCPAEPNPTDNPDGPILIHPGSSAIKRCWPVERYEDLVLELKALGHSVQVVFGEVEWERWSEERKAHWTQRLKAQVARSADTLLPILSETRLFIGNDAGPLYIAAQLGTPSLGILGPTDPNKSAPTGKHIRYVGPPDGPGRIETVTIEAVLAAADLESLA